MDLIAAVACAVLAAGLSLAEVHPAIRLVVGITATLVLPGYSLASLAFPRPAEASPTDRLVLAGGLSLVVLSSLALALDRSPWGLSARSIVIVTTIWTCAIAAAAYARRRAGRLPAPGASTEPAQAKGRRLDRWHRRPLVWLTGAAGIALTVFVTALSQEHAPSTDFYLLGPTGLAEDYPREATIGQPLTLTAQIENHEGERVSYVLTVHDPAAGAGGTTLFSVGPFSVPAEETVALPISFSAQTAGRGRQYVFFLSKAGEKTAYRELRLWLDVLPAGAP